jgi:hypothetical protein
MPVLSEIRERDKQLGCDITAEMMEAGARLLNLYADGCLGPRRSAYVAEAVFRAMRDASPQSSRGQSRLRDAPVSKRHRRKL